MLFECVLELWILVIRPSLPSRYSLISCSHQTQMNLTLVISWMVMMNWTHLKFYTWFDELIKTKVAWGKKIFYLISKYFIFAWRSLRFYWAGDRVQEVRVVSRWYEVEKILSIYIASIIRCCATFAKFLLMHKRVNLSNKKWMRNLWKLANKYENQTALFLQLSRCH